MKSLLPLGAVLASITVVAIGCGSTPSIPTAPTPTAAFTISGQVNEAPTPDVVVPNARIEVSGGPLSGQVFSTDSQGRFTLPPVTMAGFSLTFKKAEYDDLTYPVNELPGDGSLNISMQAATVVDRWQGVVVADPPHDPFAQFSGWPGDVQLTIRHYGNVTLTIGAGCLIEGTYTGLSVGLFSQAGGLLLDAWDSAKTATRAITPGTYMIRNQSTAVRAQSGCPWNIELQHPL